MLRGVVSDQGTAELAAIPGYAVAGKTGTAQKPGPNGYIPGAYVATFVGMVPASRPRLLVLVTIDEPHGQIYAASSRRPRSSRSRPTTSSTSKCLPTLDPLADPKEGTAPAGEPVSRRLRAVLLWRLCWVGRLCRTLAG